MNKISQQREVFRFPLSKGDRRDESGSRRDLNRISREMIRDRAKTEHLSNVDRLQRDYLQKNTNDVIVYLFYCKM
jgi:hypothetical protein